MNKPLTKLGFYLTLYATRTGLRRGRVREVDDREPRRLESATRRRVFFWTPATTAGAQVIVHDIVPEIRRVVAERGLPWEVDYVAEIPAGAIDDLVCFKAVPDAGQRGRSKRVIMLICDQADVFWRDLPLFDAVVATSSRPFARLVSARHPRVSFIGESEPEALIAWGAERLGGDFAGRRELLWHGGAYSQNALLDLRSMLGELDLGPDARLHVVSGREAERTERWGRLAVRYSPWSIENLQAAAATARLGIVPARASLKSSWLKPASRVRRLFALGVPAIGDRRVPDVECFMAEFGGPVAAGVAEWRSVIRQCWSDEDGLRELAQRGHAAVAMGHSASRTARQWLNFLAAGDQV